MNIRKFFRKIIVDNIMSSENPRKYYFKLKYFNSKNSIDDIMVILPIFNQTHT